MSADFESGKYTFASVCHPCREAKPVLDDAMIGPTYCDYCGEQMEIVATRRKRDDRCS